MEGVHRTGKTSCPGCGYVIDAHTSIHDPSDKPSPNDISICAKCGDVNKYAEDMTLVKFTQEDRDKCEEGLLAEIDKISGRFKAQYKKTLN